jgi:hypothetical protein
MRDWRHHRDQQLHRGRALGTGTLGQANSSNTALDVWNMQANYGINNFDIKFIYNVAMFYQPKFFRSQNGVIGKVLGGWTISPLFTAQSGAGISPTYSQGGCTGCQAFGEVTLPSASSATTENAVALRRTPVAALLITTTPARMASAPPAWPA